MSRFYLEGVNGTTEHKNAPANDLYHDLAVNSTGFTAGTLIITGRKPGSPLFEAIPDGVIDLTAPTSIQFTGGVAVYKFGLAGLVGEGSITITDNSQGA